MCVHSSPCALVCVFFNMLVMNAVTIKIILHEIYIKYMRVIIVQRSLFLRFHFFLSNFSLLSLSICFWNFSLIIILRFLQVIPTTSISLLLVKKRNDMASRRNYFLHTKYIGTALCLPFWVHQFNNFSTGNLCASNQLENILDIWISKMIIEISCIIRNFL